MTAALRGARVEVRMPRTQKRDIERAASLRGTSVTDLILEAVQPAATEAIREFEVLELRKMKNDLEILGLVSGMLLLTAVFISANQSRKERQRSKS